MTVPAGGVGEGWTNRAFKRKCSGMKSRIRELLRATPFLPFIIRMADGHEHRIEHPDFVLAAPETPQVLVEEPDGRVHFLSVLLISSVEVAADKRAA